jgi:hypothetical protein
LALVGSYELLMMLIRADHDISERQDLSTTDTSTAPAAEHGVAPAPFRGPALEQTVLDWHTAGRSQRVIARDLSIDRRKVTQII